MAIFNKEYKAESKVKYDDKIRERAADIYRKIQNNLNNNHLFTLYPIRKDQINFTKKDNDITSNYVIGKVNKNESNKDDIRKIITSARYIINDEVKKCRVSIYDQTDGFIYSSITLYNSANKYILSEASKYSYYSWQDDDEDEIDKPAKLIKHLSNTEIRRAKDIIKSTISKYPKIKKCCDYIDLYDTEEFDDDGNRSSALERYKKRNGSAYFKLVDGDVFSGYPNFRGEGSEDFNDDVEDLKKEINEKFKQLNFPAEFVVKNDDEAINFGVISKKS